MFVILYTDYLLSSSYLLLFSLCIDLLGDNKKRKTRIVDDLDSGTKLSGFGSCQLSIAIIDVSLLLLLLLFYFYSVIEATGLLSLE